MSWRRRGVGFAVATVLIAIALVYALRPFTKTLAFTDAAWSPSPTDQEPTPFAVSGECRAAVVSAPGRGDDEVALWAVTVGTDQIGFMPVPQDEPKEVLRDDFAATGRVDLPDGLCATRARERLAVAAIFLLAAGGVSFLTIRRRRQAPV